MTTFTPMLWASMTDEQKYEEYVRVRTLLEEAQAVPSSPPSSGIAAECWYCHAPGFLYRHSGGYNISMCDKCRGGAVPSSPSIADRVGEWESIAALLADHQVAGATVYQQVETLLAASERSGS